MMLSGVEDGGAGRVEMEAVASIWRRASSPKRRKSDGEGMGLRLHIVSPGHDRAEAREPTATASTSTFDGQP